MARAQSISSRLESLYPHAKNDTIAKARRMARRGAGILFFATVLSGGLFLLVFGTEAQLYYWAPVMPAIAAVVGLVGFLYLRHNYLGALMDQLPRHYFSWTVAQGIRASAQLGQQTSQYKAAAAPASDKGGKRENAKEPSTTWEWIGVALGLMLMAHFVSNKPGKQVGVAPSELVRTSEAVSRSLAGSEASVSAGESKPIGTFTGKNGSISLTKAEADRLGSLLQTYSAPQIQVARSDSHGPGSTHFDFTTTPYVITPQAQWPPTIRPYTEDYSPRRLRDFQGNTYTQPYGAGFAQEDRTGKQCFRFGAFVQCN